MRHSLRFRILAVLVLVVVAVVGTIALVSTQLTTRTFQGYEDRRVSTRDRRFQGLLVAHYARHGNWSKVQPELERMGQITGERMVLVDTDGRIVADSEGVLTGQEAGYDWGRPPAPIAPRGTPVGALYVGPTVTGAGIEGLLASTNRTSLLVAVGAGAGAVLLIAGLSRRVLGPVEALTEVAQKMAAGDLSQRVEIDSRDEIGELAGAFNHMAEGLARLEQLRRTMVADVAHELRTPLTNLRGYLQAISDGVAAPDDQTLDLLLEEAVLLSNLVDEPQDLSLAEAEQLRLERHPVELRQLVAPAIASFRPRASAKGINLTRDLPENSLTVNVDSQRMGQVLRNLLENAVAHTERGGSIRVAGRAIQGDVDTPGYQSVALSVGDSGVGIAPLDLPFIFERFYRADRSRARATGGSGLGLAIARQLVQAHGGQIGVESTVGQGTTFTVTLPVAVSPSL